MSSGKILFGRDRINSVSLRKLSIPETLCLGKLLRGKLHVSETISSGNLRRETFISPSACGSINYSSPLHFDPLQSIIHFDIPSFHPVQMSGRTQDPRICKPHPRSKLSSLPIPQDPSILCRPESQESLYSWSHRSTMFNMSTALGRVYNRSGSRKDSWAGRTRSRKATLASPRGQVYSIQEYS